MNPEPTSISRGIGRALLVLAIPLAWLAMAAPTARADNLDNALLMQTEDLNKFIESKNAKTVGVLKFRAQRGDGAKTFHLGPITTIMAERLEAILILGNRPSKPTNIIRDASGVAAAAKQKIDYLTPEGRKKLFALKYPLVVGDQKASPDLFLTGFVKLDPKSHKTIVTLAAFDRKSTRIELIPGIKPIEVSTDRALLGDAGQSFTLTKRSLKRNSEEQDLFADKNAEERDKGGSDKKEDVVKSTEESLVELKMFINDEEISFEPDPSNPGENRFSCREPKEGDKVKFTLTNKSDMRVAVVLFVNGTNTLYEQKDEAVKCNKWVLDPGDSTLIIDGFYINDSGKENKKSFTVLSDEASAQAMESLGDETQGTIQMHVFGEGAGTEDEKTTGIRGLSRRAWANNKRSLSSPAKARELLVKSQSTKGRGLLAGNQNPEDGSKLKTVEFKDPQEKAHVFVRYYKKPGT